MSGGDFWSGLKDFGKDILQGIKNVSDTATHVGRNALDTVSKVAPLLPLLAAGDGYHNAHSDLMIEGGARGRRVTKKQLLGKLKERY
jgi:hypothetical protein